MKAKARSNSVNGSQRITKPKAKHVERSSFRLVVQFDHSERSFPNSLALCSDGGLYFGNPIAGDPSCAMYVITSARAAAAWFMGCRFLCSKPQEVDEELFAKYLGGLLAHEDVHSVDIPTIPAVQQMAKRSGLSYDNIARSLLTLALFGELEKFKTADKASA